MTIAITLGSNAEFYIDAETGMGIRQVNPVEPGQPRMDVPLGPATEKRLDTILLHMGSMRIHTERK